MAYLVVVLLQFEGNSSFRTNVPVNSKTAHPPRANPRAFDFFEKFWSIPRYVASLDGQMPHPLELERGSNPPPSRENRITFL